MKHWPHRNGPRRHTLARGSAFATDRPRHAPHAIEEGVRACKEDSKVGRRGPLSFVCRLQVPSAVAEEDLRTREERGSPDTCALEREDFDPSRSAGACGSQAIARERSCRFCAHGSCRVRGVRRRLVVIAVAGERDGERRSSDGRRRKRTSRSCEVADRIARCGGATCSESITGTTRCHSEGHITSG